jgi:hypothetical protein
MTISYVRRSPIPQLTHPGVTSHRYDMNDVKRSLMQQLIKSNVISRRCDVIDVKNNDKNLIKKPDAFPEDYCGFRHIQTSKGKR